MKKTILCLVFISIIFGLIGCKNRLVVTEITEKLVSNEYLKTERVLSSYNEDSTLKGRFLEGIKDITTSEFYEKNYQIQSSYINYGDYAIVIGDGSYDETEGRIEQSKKLYIIDKNNNKCLLKEFDKEIYQISIKDKTKIICIVELTKNNTDRKYIEYDLFTGEEKVLVENTRDLYFYHNNILYHRDEFDRLSEIKESIFDRKNIYTDVSWIYRDSNDLIIILNEQKYIEKYNGENTVKVEVTNESYSWLDNNTVYVNNYNGQIRIKNLKENKITVLNIEDHNYVEKVLGNYCITLRYGEDNYQYYLIDLNNGNKYMLKENLVIDNYDYRYEADIFMFNDVIYFYDLTKDNENVSSQYSRLMSLDLSQLEKVQ